MTKVFRLMGALTLVATLCLVSVAPAGALGTGPYLIKILRTDSRIESVLRDLSVPVHFKLEKWYIAGAGTSHLERLDEAGLVYEVIDEEAWSEPYYVIDRPQREDIGPVPDLGKLIFLAEKEALVKIDGARASDLARAGFRLTRLFPKALPLTERPVAKPHPVWKRLADDDVVGAIVSQVSQATLGSYVQRLQDFRTRYFDTDSINAAAQWLFDRFVDFGYTDVVFDVFVDPGHGVTVKNVIATKPGTLYPDSVIIIGGHYDSVVYDGTNTYLWAPGADDNASGTVAVLEAARILGGVDLDCTVKFACWTAEEIGLYGAWNYAEKAYRRGENIGLYINFDMIGNLDQNDPLRNVNIMRNASSQAYAELMADMTERYTSLVPAIHSAGGGSDHVPFVQYGYNILYGEEGDFSPNWHRASDVIQNMDIPYMCEVVKMGLATLATVAGPPESFPDPVIAFESYVADDDDEGGSTGNGNGYFDPGETVEVSLSLRNYGGAQASDVSGHLLTSDPYVTVLDGTRTFGDISPGGAGICQGQFRFAISERCPNGRYINFTLEVHSAEGGEWTAYFTVRVEQPLITYLTFGLEDRVGDGDGALDPGETVDLYLFLWNDGLRPASGITLELGTEDADVTIINTEAGFPDMPLNSIAENSGDPFTFSLSEASSRHSIIFTAHLSEGQGSYGTDMSFRVLSGQGRVLLVADDDGDDAFLYYMEAFQQMGVMYTLWGIETRGKIAEDSLSNYGEVIWFTGAIGQRTLTDEDQVALANYLDGGGHLLLSGSLIGFDIGETSFYRDYVHARYVHFFTRLHHLRSGAGNPVVGGMNIDLSTSGRNLQTFTGEIDPIPPAFTLFTYDRGTAEGPGDIRSSGNGAVAFESDRYKTAYFSFGLEGVEPFEDRVALLGKTLDWFNAPVVVKGDVNGDGRYNVLDVVLAVRIGLESYDPTGEEFERADINYDGSVDILDVMGIVYLIVHK